MELSPNTVRLEYQQKGAFNPFSVPFAVKKYEPPRVESDWERGEIARFYRPLTQKRLADLVVEADQIVGEVDTVIKEAQRQYISKS